MRALLWGPSRAITRACCIPKCSTSTQLNLLLSLVQVEIIAEGEQVNELFLVVSGAVEILADHANVLGNPTVQLDNARDREGPMAGFKFASGTSSLASLSSYDDALASYDDALSSYDDDGMGLNGNGNAAHSNNGKGQHKVPLVRYIDSKGRDTWRAVWDAPVCTAGAVFPLLCIWSSVQVVCSRLFVFQMGMMWLWSGRTVCLVGWHVLNAQHSRGQKRGAQSHCCALLCNALVVLL